MPLGNASDPIHATSTWIIPKVLSILTHLSFFISKILFYYAIERTDQFGP